MQINKKIHRQIRLQNIAFNILMLVAVSLLAWLSTRYHFTADWTANNRNSLNEASITIIQGIQGPVTITAFAREAEMLRAPITELIARYQQHKPDIQLAFINPDTAPDQVRAHNISMEGELIISYGGRSENLRDLSEQAITNTLQRLSRSSERWLVFIKGHGERSSEGAANHDLSEWTKHLKSKGLRIQSINLSTSQAIPDNTSVLVIAGPQADLLPGEVTLIKDYLDQGGNLLWLADPEPLHGLAPIAETLGVDFHPGVIVEPATRLLGIGDPRFALVANYPDHAITRGFDILSLFPLATGIASHAVHDWISTPLLSTTERSWVETGAISDNVSYDKDSDIAGPVTLGITLTRQSPDTTTSEDKEQRVVVIADGDFLSNAYLGNGGNLDLGSNIVNWLSHDDQFVTIPTRGALDRHVELSQGAQIFIAASFLVLIPLGLLTSGLVIWLRRRRR